MIFLEQFAKTECSVTFDTTVFAEFFKLTPSVCQQFARSHKEGTGRKIILTSYPMNRTSGDAG
jgi:hypothetical protein